MATNTRKLRFKVAAPVSSTGPSSGTGKSGHSSSNTGHHLQSRATRPNLEPSHVFGILDGVSNPLHFVSDTRIIFPASTALVVQNIDHLRPAQRFLPCSENHSVVAIAVTSKLLAYAESSYRAQSQCIILCDLATLKRKRVIRIDDLFFSSGGNLGYPGRNTAASPTDVAGNDTNIQNAANNSPMTTSAGSPLLLGGIQNTVQGISHTDNFTKRTTKPPVGMTELDFGGIMNADGALSSNAREIVTIALSPDSRLVACLLGEPDWPLAIWSCEKGVLVAQIRHGHATQLSSYTRPQSLSFNPFEKVASRLCVTGTCFFRIYKFSDNTLKALNTVKADHRNVTSHLWVSNDRLLLALEDSRILLCEASEVIAEIVMPQYNAPAPAANHAMQNGFSFPMTAQGTKVSQPQTDSEAKAHRLLSRPVVTQKQSTKRYATVMRVTPAGFIVGTNVGSLQVWERSGDQEKHQSLAPYTFVREVPLDSGYVSGICISHLEDNTFVLVSGCKILQIQHLLVEEVTNVETVLHAHSVQIVSLSSCIRKPFIATCTGCSSAFLLSNREDSGGKRTSAKKKDADNVPLSTSHRVGSKTVLANSDGSQHYQSYSNIAHTLRRDSAESQMLNTRNTAVDSTVRIWNYVDGTIETMKTFVSDPTCVSLHPSGLYILVSFTDSIRLLKIVQSSMQNMWSQPARKCRQCAFSHGGQFFAYSLDSAIVVRSTWTLDIISFFFQHTAPVVQLKWSRDDKHIMSICSSDVLYIWNSRAASISMRIPSLDFTEKSVNNESDHDENTNAKLVELLNAEGTIAAKAMNGYCPPLQNASAISTHSVAQSSTIAIPGALNPVGVQKTNSVISFAVVPKCVESTADGSFLVGTASGLILVIKSGTIVSKVEAALQSEGITFLAVSPYSKFVAFGTAVGHVKLVSYLMLIPATNEQESTGPNSRRLAQATESQATSNRERIPSSIFSQLTCHAALVSNVCFTPDEDYVVSTGLDGSIFVSKISVVSFTGAENTAIVHSANTNLVAPATTAHGTLSATHSTGGNFGATNNTIASFHSNSKTDSARNESMQSKDCLFGDEILVQKYTIREKSEMTQSLRQQVENMRLQNEASLQAHDKSSRAKYKEHVQKLIATKQRAMLDIETDRASLKNFIESAAQRYAAVRQESKNEIEELMQYGKGKMMRQAERFEELKNQLQLAEKRRAAQLEEQRLLDTKSLEELRERHRLELQAQTAALEELRQKIVETRNDRQNNSVASEMLIDSEVQVMQYHFERRLCIEVSALNVLRRDRDALIQQQKALQQVIESNKAIQANVKIGLHNLNNAMHDREKDLAVLRREMSERTDTLEEKDIRIGDLRRTNIELENFRFVLEFKIKELAGQIAPREERIKELKATRAGLDGQLATFKTMRDSLSLKIRRADLCFAAAKIELGNTQYRCSTLYKQIQNLISKTKAFLEPMLLKIETADHFSDAREKQDCLRKATKQLASNVIKLYHTECANEKRPDGQNSITPIAERRICKQASRKNGPQSHDADNSGIYGACEESGANGAFAQRVQESLKGRKLLMRIHKNVCRQLQECRATNRRKLKALKAENAQLINIFNQGKAD